MKWLWQRWVTNCPTFNFNCPTFILIFSIINVTKMSKVFLQIPSFQVHEGCALESITDVTWASAFLNQNFAKSQSFLVSLAVQTLKGASNSIFKRIVPLKDLVSCTGKSGPGFCPSCMAITLRSSEGWKVVFICVHEIAKKQRDSSEIWGRNYCQWKVYLWWWFRRATSW